MAACLGESYERFSVRLPTYPILSDASIQRYVHEYMEVGKKDAQNGKLTRFIASNEELFGLEVTMMEGFNHGYYDGVMIKLCDVHSGGTLWQKKYPKSSSAREPMQKDKRILIESLDYSKIDGTWKSNVQMKLAPLVPEEDFVKHGANPDRQYPRMLEGIRIEVCKYKESGNLKLTKDEFDLKVQEHALKLVNYAGQMDNSDSLDTLKRTPVHRSVYRKHKITHKLRQVFASLEFFDTVAVAQTPIPSIRQSWDLLSSKEREIAYGKLSRHDFKQIWSHHYNKLGPNPKKAAIDALKNELRKNLPEYWRSWHKLYAYEIPAAFKKLQERRRYLDKGEIPEDSEVVGKSEKAAIDLENQPERLEKPSENIRVPHLNLGLTGASCGSGLAIPAPTPEVILANKREIGFQVQPDYAIERMGAATIKPAHVQPTAGFSGDNFVAPSPGKSGSFNTKPVCTNCDRRFSGTQAFIHHCQNPHGRNFARMDQAVVAGRITDSTDAKSLLPCGTLSSTSTYGTQDLSTTETLSAAKNMLATPSLLDTAALTASNVPRLLSSDPAEEIHRCVTEKAPIKPCCPQLSNLEAATLPTIKSEAISWISKRHSEFPDLSIPKRQAMGNFEEISSEIKPEHIPNEIVEETRPANSSVSASVSASVDEESELSISEGQPPADRMDIDVHQNITPNITKTKSEPPRIVINTTTNEPVHVTEMFPETFSLISESASMDAFSPRTPLFTASSKLIAASHLPKVKSKDSRDISKPTTEAEASLAPIATLVLKTDIPSKFENSPSPIANTPLTHTKIFDSPSIPIIDLETWVPFPAFTATYLSITSSVPMFKSEADAEKKPELSLNGLTGLDTELKRLEEEAWRKEIELEDAMRVAEARKERNALRRRIEQLRTRELVMGGD
ncbi:hypothetical protein DSL72_008964 [Monilinia vaccinii-corymbosi]|uniref:C2H2-type domain-containing protein n=1 Tax=Monilinia vaccinii-corymbosi TaxID=61207 RepID=A0A8A3PSM2_9HELO|nr:hypothetical protein DSL72_008964 [Monilinia vaccinii-corymbosi]